MLVRAMNIIAFALFSLAISVDTNAQTVININADSAVKPISLKFGSGVGILCRPPQYPPVDLSDTRLLDIINEAHPTFINLSYTGSPQSILWIQGLPFYLQTTGTYSQRHSYIEMFNLMGIDSTSTGANADLYALITSLDTLPDGPITVGGNVYTTYRDLFSVPPHKNYDDLLQFFERLDDPPEMFLRIPLFFFGIIDDPLPHTGPGPTNITIELDPQTGADMVHYLNDGPETTYGQLRAQNGHPQPYNIKYFMLGNEMWWPSATYGLSTQRIIAQVNAFAQAMKTAVSSISLVFNPVDDAFPTSFLRLSDPVMGPIIDTLLLFNSAVTDSIKANIDAIQFFQYGIAIGQGDSLLFLDTEGWKTALALPYIYELYDNAGAQRAIVDSFGVDVPMILGEFGGPTARLGGAIFSADYILYMLAHQYDLFIANWELGLIENNFYGMIRQDFFGIEAPTKRPYFFVQQMFDRYLGDTIIYTQLTGSPTYDAQSFETPDFLIYPAQQGVPTLHIMATMTTDTLFLMVINRDLDSSIQATVHLTGFVPEDSASVHTLNGPTIDAHNEIDPSNVALADSVVYSIASTFSYTFEKHSVTSLVLVRVAGACCELPGDVNSDGSLDIVDLTCMVDFLFGTGCTIPCTEEADVNGNGGVDIVDLTCLVDHLFGSPGPNCPAQCP